MSSLALSTCNDLYEFNKNLFSETLINYVEYSRIYEDGSTVFLTTNPYFYQHFVEKKFARPSPKIYSASGIYIWAGINGLEKFDPQLSDMKNIFNIDHGVSFVEVHKNYIEVFDYASSPENKQIINFYINNREQLQNHYHLLKETFYLTIKKLERSPLIVPLRPPCIQIPQTPSDLVSLSAREKECLALLKMGYTSKEIARQLIVSPRTVEKYLDNTRFKLNAKNRSEVIYIANKLNLLY